MTALPATLELDQPHDPRGLGGLLALVGGEPQALPLQRVAVRARLVGDVAWTRVTQTFHNPLERPVEAVHIFPLPADGAVTAVVLEAGDVRVQAECRERQEAQVTFEEARKAGHRAALLTHEGGDVHTLRVTNLPPGESVRVHVEVVEQLRVADGKHRWRFPTVIAPRYLPGEAIGHAGPGVLPDTDRVPDASRLQPPLRLSGGTELDLEVEVAGPVTHLASSLHAIRVDLEGGLRVAPSGSATLDRDFVLEFGTAAAADTEPRAWTDGAHTLVVLNPPSAGFPEALPRDAVFVVDISGSMGGTKMVAAKRALQSALRGLLPGDRLRVIAFDDRVESFHPDFLPFDDATLQRAEAWIGALQPRGGTEMLPPIREALAGETPEGRLRTVLFITDGQAWNEAELVAAVANRRKEGRFFTMGIDTAVNSALLERLARVGGGTCELMAPSDNVEAAVVRLEARFGSPIVHDVRVDGKITASQALTTVFTGRPVTLLVEGSEPVTLVGRVAEGERRWGVSPVRTDAKLGVLWARRRVAALEDRLWLKPFEEEALRPEILRLGLEWSLATRFTSFVAVERTRVVDGEPVEVVQPAELPAGWEPPEPRVHASTMSGAPVRKPVRRSPRAHLKKKGARRRDMAPGAYAPPPAPQAVGAYAGPPAPPSPVPLAERHDDAFGGLPVEKELAALEAPPADDLDTEAAAPSSMAMLGATVASAFRRRAPAPPPEPEPEPEPEDTDPAAFLAHTQLADGSWDQDTARTAAGLIALLFLGHTRRAGLWQRAVLKAARWLQRNRDDVAALALDALVRVESGEALAWSPDFTELLHAPPEGDLLEPFVR